MTEAFGAAMAALAAVLTALITSWVGLRQYKRNVTQQIRADSVQAILTEEHLQADFRREIRQELERMRTEVDARKKAYHALEEENRVLKVEVTKLEVEVMKLRGQLEMHGILTGAPAITGSRNETAARAERANGGESV